MTEPTWEIDAPALAITVRWGDVALHTAHLAPPRSFFLGGLGADCVLPESAVGAGRAPLLLAERGAVYLVLHPSMDPDGVITAPGREARAVADLARAGMAEASSEVSGGFLIKLAPGMTAALTIGDFAITIALEAKAARAAFGHVHFSRRVAPFQLGSAALHLALVGFASAAMGPLLEPGETSPEQIHYVQQVLQAVAERELAERGEGDEPPVDLRGSARRGSALQLLASTDLYDGYTRARRMEAEREKLAPRGASGPPGGEVNLDDDVDVAIDPRVDRSSTFAVNVGDGAYAAARRSLQRGELPSPASVRPEDFLNGFDYRYPDPDPDATTPFAVHLAAAPSPFEAGHHLLRVGVQGRRDARDGARGWGRKELARDVTIEVDFNPSVVRSYRRLGDPSREAREGDSPEGRLDGDQIATGHTVTAMYDVVLASAASSPATVRIHYQPPSHDEQQEEERESVFVLPPRAISPSFDAAPASLRLAVAAVGFAEILREGPRAEGWRLDDVERIAYASAGVDAPEQELAALVHAARSLVEERRATRWSRRVADASLMGF